MKKSKPVVYISSPYTLGDQGLNVRYQCEIFNLLLSQGLVLPVAPLWSHFQHLIYPKSNEEWLAYDLAMIPKYDACLRLDAENKGMNYRQSQSEGADKEVELFKQLGKPVFYTIEELDEWVKAR